MVDAIAAYAHYIAILAVAALLGSELVLYRAVLPAPYARTLQRIDAWFGISAILLIVTGVGRVYASHLGWFFFTHNPMFWLKMGLFATLGVLSIWPTRHYLSWNTTAEVAIEPATARKIRRFLIAEILVLACIPLCAALMARGIGLR